MFSEKLLNQKKFDEIILESNIPVIETHEINNWEIKNFDAKSIFNSFLKTNNIKESDFCFFDSTIKKTNGSIISFFNLTSKYNTKYGYRAIWYLL